MHQQFKVQNVLYVDYTDYCYGSYTTTTEKVIGFDEEICSQQPHKDNKEKRKHPI